VNSSIELTSPLAKRLLNYWRRHKYAEGTAEAIAEWWLLEQAIREAVDDVRTALDELVASGRVIRRELPDGRVLYRLSQTKTSKGNVNPVS